jgi:hypothetical protein
MPSVLIVEKNGSVKQVDIKSYNEAELYKKAGIKSAEGFVLQTSWSADIKDKKYNVHLYGKTTGKANFENKYEFPPPVDNVLFFGSCILVNIINGVVSNLNEKEWEQIYEFLYGGFEDIEESEDEESEDDDIPRTKSGYAKDGFIVDDDEEDGDDDLDDEDESEEEALDEDEEEVYVKTKKTSKISVKAAAKKPANTRSKKKVVSVETEIPEMNYMDCTKELDYEEYT